MPERAREPHSYQVTALTAKCNATLKETTWKESPGFLADSIFYSASWKSVNLDIWPKFCVEIGTHLLLEKEVRCHSGQGKTSLKTVIYLPGEPLACCEPSPKMQILSWRMSMAADVATSLRIIWEPFFYYYYHHHYHYFNLAIRLIWFSQHFQQIAMAWRSVCVCVCVFVRDSCYPVLGVNALSTNMCPRLKPDEWEGAREKEGLLTILFLINMNVINMTA